MGRIPLPFPPLPPNQLQLLTSRPSSESQQLRNYSLPAKVRSCLKTLLRPLDEGLWPLFL